jgi:DNA invertase Pin-like site-specific DNA recombinase
MDGFPCSRKADRAPSLNRSIAGRGPPGKVAAMPDTLGYARVSTGDQDLAGQVLRLKAAGAARTYQDVISGRTFDRPGLKALLDYARAGDTLAVVRLGRSLRELLEVVETLKARQIALVSLEEKIDTTSAAGELVFHVFGAIAQFERRLIAERTRDGVAAARAEGRHPGRPKLDQEKLRAALTLIRNGMSPTKAARHVGLGRSTLYRELALIPGALPRAVYTG